MTKFPKFSIFPFLIGFLLFSNGILAKDFPKADPVVATDLSPPMFSLLGWNRKQAITIDHNKVVGSTDLTDFPFLVTLDHLDGEVVDGGARSALNGGGDPRFTIDPYGSRPVWAIIISCPTTDLMTNSYK